MRPGEPSRTAYAAAAHRAVHQELEGGRVFRDPLAWRILGDVDRQEVLARAAERPRQLRMFIAVRHRFAEDSLALAVRRGTRQAVVLGAGLDTFAYRNPHPGLRVLEVDHPETGRWKQERLRAAGIAGDATYVGVDFERDDLLGRLVEHGLDPDRPAFFLWLGVVPYLTPEAVRETLAVIAGTTGGEVVLDYPTPTEDLGGEAREARRALHDRVARASEPMRSTFRPEEMAALLAGVGLDEVEDLGRAEFLPRFFGVRPEPGAGPGGGHVVRARATDARGDR